MEVACSLDEFARALTVNGYINDDSCFADATDLPSMLSAFESSHILGTTPDSFPESPCSDEDIAKVLDLTQIPSPSALDSCISDNFEQLPTVPTVFESSVVSSSSSSSAGKTRDPCITNAVFNCPPTVFSFKSDCRFPKEIPCFTYNLVNNYTTQGFPSLHHGKENMSNQTYFDNMSPVSDEDPGLQISPGYSNATEEEKEKVGNTSPDSISIEQEGSSAVKTSAMDLNASQTEGPKTQVERVKQKRKRKRSGFSKPSKAKKKCKETKLKTPTPKKQPEPKPKKAKLSRKVENEKSKFASPVISTEMPTQHSGNASQVLASNTTHEIRPNSSSGNDETIPSENNSENARPLRRSSRSHKCPDNYNLRLSSLVKRVETERRQQEPKPPKGKVKPPPLSKYRRRTANARERDRMKEINDGFEDLKQCLPVTPDFEESKQKMTKFSVLKMALNYIAALRDTLGLEPVPFQTTPTSDSPNSSFPASSNESKLVNLFAEDICSNSSSEAETVLTNTSSISTSVCKISNNTYTSQMIDANL